MVEDLGKAIDKAYLQWLSGTVQRTRTAQGCPLYF